MTRVITTRRPQQVTDPATEAAGGSILSKLSGRPVRCYQCGEWFKAATRAMTASCTHCNRQVNVDDIDVKATHWGGAIMSCGRVTIGKKVTCRSKLVVACHGIRVLGRLDGDVVCGGPVLVGKTGTLIGSVRAPSLVVERGGSIDGDARIPDQPIGSVELQRMNAGRLRSA